MPRTSPRVRDWVVATMVAVSACDKSTRPDPPVPTRLAFEAQPSNATAGAALTPQVSVRVLDASGNAFTGSATVTVSLVNANGAALVGTTSAAAVNGVATFSDLRVQKAGVGYALTATSGSLTAATSNPFDVTHAAAAKLRFVTQPSEATAGRPLSPAVTVEITDEYDNVATSAAHAVTISRDLTAPISVFVLGTATVSAVAGLATFGNISLNRTGAYALRATAAGLNAAVSSAVLVKAASVARFCPADAASGASFRALQDAIGAAEPGGTVAICDGTHDINGVVVDRPLTIIPENDGKVTVRNRGTFSFFVSAVDQGTVRIARLKFEVAAPGAVTVHNRYDEVIIEGSTFQSLGDGVMAIIAGQNLGPATNATVTIRGNTAIGFRDAFQAQSNLRMDVIGNRIDSSTSNAITYGRSTRGVIQGNRIRQCGRNACISAVPLEGGPVEVVENDIENDISRNTGNGIRTQGRVNVRRNRIIGTGGTGVGGPMGLGSFAFYPAAISIIGHEGVTPVVEGNEVRNAWWGIELAVRSPGGSIMRDNRISDVGWGYAPHVSTPADVFERNDVSNFVDPVAAPAVVAARFKCNWWGRAIGPVPEAFSTVFPFLEFQPFSTVPIAGRPEVACDPAGPPAPTRFCPTEFSAGKGWSRFVDAIAATQSGGTILVCDGTHSVNVGLDRPMTIAGEHPLGATLDGGNGTVFSLGNAGPGTYAFRDVNFVVGPATAIWLGTGTAAPLGTYDLVVVERNRFRLNSSSSVGVRVMPSGIAGAKVTIRGNTFTGGMHGVVALHAGPLEILGNTLEGQLPGSSNASIDLRGTVGGSSGPYVVRENRLSRCPHTCIRSMEVTAEIVANVLDGRVADLTRTGIHVSGRPTVSRNTIGSSDAVADRSDANAYAFPAAAIWIDGGPGIEEATVDGNVIRNAFAGIVAYESPFVTGRDNVVTLTNTGLQVFRVGQTFHRNDFMDYVLAASGIAQPAGSLRCNYWGSASAPAVGPELQSAVQPHSPVSIAGKPSVSCP